MAVKLTEGAISMISTGQWQTADVKPVLQVVELRIVQTQTPAAGGGGGENKERYRMVLSDGLFHQQGMLATQRNELVRSQRLQRGSIVQLTEFVCNTIRERTIIIIIDLDVILEKCDIIGEAKPCLLKLPGSETTPIARSAAPVQSSPNQPLTTMGSPQSFSGSSLSGSLARPITGVDTPIRTPGTSEREHSASVHSYGNSYINNRESGRYNSPHAASMHSRTGPANSVHPVQPAYNQPLPMYANRGPIAKNEAPPRIIPIAALNPYQGRWTIKARVTAKAELRRYNNAKGDGKVFSFDLLDSDGGEIRVTCFNAVADQFYSQIEPGKVYYISKGTLKPAQKAFNHLKNDHEIMLDSTSTIQPCFDNDTSIPHQQFHFCSIGDIEGMENNTVLDVIGVVSSINPSSSIMRKNGTETHKRTLHLKDMSGRSIELTLWGNFCNAEGQTLQNMCDSGVSPVLAVKSARVSEFNGKSIGTISTSQLCIEPDFPEAHKLKAWFDNVGKNTMSVSISRDAVARTDIWKTISQIKDEKLGTSEKPDWITVNATIWHMKAENFCYTACPIMLGDRQCNKKVINTGDGKWRCDRCDQTVDQCDYRYILQLQIQDHTGLTWITAFQETADEIIGVSAKDLYSMKYEEQDEDRFSETIHNILFTKYSFKLKVKEEMYSDEQRVKSTVVKAEKIKFSSATRYLLHDLQRILKKDDPSSITMETANIDSALDPQFGDVAFKHTGQQTASSASQMGHYGGSRLPTNGYSGPSVVNAQGYSSGERFNSSVPSGGGTINASGECYKCHQNGHWARDCHGLNNVPSAYGSGNTAASGECYKCHQSGHWAKDCPGISNVTPSHGSGNTGGSGECYKCHQMGHWARDCPGVSNVGPGRYGSSSKQYVGGY